MQSTTSWRAEMAAKPSSATMKNAADYGIRSESFDGHARPFPARERAQLATLVRGPISRRRQCASPASAT
jgi:hypothetical protein